MSAPPLVLLTVTWSADKNHFALLRHSIERSQFAEVPHHVVVQHEDLELFRQFPGVVLHSSADILPGDVEHRRRAARAWQQRLGRRATNWGGSLARTIHWPSWVRYTGWHTQQLSKLAFTAQAPSDTVAIMDSDLVVTPHAQAADFLSPGRIVCYQKILSGANIRGKVLHWQETAHQLFGRVFNNTGTYDGYYDTPFVMHAPALRGLIDHLQQNQRKPWWEQLLDLPPRRWSEFGIYKQYLREFHRDVEWRDTRAIGYLFDASDPQHLTAEFRRLRDEEQCHYITIHSQSSGRQLWQVDSYLDLIKNTLDP